MSATTPFEDRWLLETGRWNDAGNWDDGDQWKDS